MTRVSVPVKGNTIDYVIPSFPMVKARLVEVKLEWVNSQGEVEAFDSFACYCTALNHALPADLIILYSFQHAFVIEVCWILNKCVAT